MANRRESLPRLNMNMQLQPIPVQQMRPPALLQQAFHPSYPMPSALQTPIQALFNSPAPPAPPRPTHHAHQASVQLAAAGIHPPNLVTPISTYFPRSSMILGSTGHPPSHPFPNRNRRQLSIGGPPKAVLGGPAHKLSPLPSTSAPNVAVTPSTSSKKSKKVIVNLPKETVWGKDGEPPTRSSWARSPLDNPFQYQDHLVIPAELTTAEVFPPDTYRLDSPNSIDVYLPGRIAWDSLKNKAIEDKLEKLGVERGSGSNVPHIYAPHARAASISSPADPALLSFKLNRLQQAQESTRASNMSLSPNPLYAPFGLSPSPHRGPRFTTNRHGHTMSLAQPPSYQSSLFSSSPLPYDSSGSTLPVSESGMDDESSSPDAIHAPQGRIPMSTPSFAPPLSAVGGNKSHIDFIRGFGLETPLESEEETEPNDDPERVDDQNNNLQEINLEERYADEVVEIEDDSTTAPHSRLHSRHVSRNSALSLRSVGGNLTSQFQDPPEETDEQDASQEHGEDAQQTALDDEVDEWTGSEDIYLGIDTTDDESIGEWSNPSDEERARQQRVERRLRRQRPQLDQPRRLPNFPLPPDNTLAFYPRGTDDDLISNPSEENMVLARRAEFLGVSTEQYYDSSNLNMDADSPRLLSFPPLPHPRVASEQHSVHDPYVAHSRATSENFNYPTSTYHRSQPSNGRSDSLNPLAKPFIFGPARASGSFQPFGARSLTPSLSSGVSMSHTRLPSIGKPLNVAAPEFKPGEFNFRLPSGAPQMPVAAFPRPQLAEESEESAHSSPFKVQGREKRQRRGSSASMEEGDSMSSFKFPMKPESPRGICRAGSFSGIPRSQQDDSTPPFTFANFSAVANNMPLVPNEAGNISMPEPESAILEDSLNDSSTAKPDTSGVGMAEVIVVPPATKTKRAPIPLEFKHSGSGNTVPAGLFKALVNSSDDRTRRNVRSRLNSHETFEHMQRPSLDDDIVPLIAHKNPTGRLVTDPGARKSSKENDDDVFDGSIRHARRRSSLPDALHDLLDEASIGAQELTTRLEFHRLETVIAELLDEKLGPLRKDLEKRAQSGEQGLSTSTEAMMTDVISLFRTQLHESATRSLDDGQMDARGDLDFQMIKEVVEEGHKGLLLAMQHEIHRLVKQLPIDNDPQEILSSVDQIGSRTVNAVIESISEFTARQEAMSLDAPAQERDILVDKLVTALSPMMRSLHNEPLDYDHLTRELTQAVKPHISQLIDLASDKRETASLIVDKILPLIPSMGNPTIDTDALTLKLITEVRRAIAPIDAFEIKEHVADLVVERLDSRLAVRDKAFNVDIVTARVTESVSHLLEALNTVPSTLNEVMSLQKTVNDQQNGFTTSHSGMMASISEIPGQVSSQLETLKDVQDDILRKLGRPVLVAEPDVNIIFIKDLVETMGAQQKSLVAENERISSQTEHLSEKLDALPVTFIAIADKIQNVLTELITSRDDSKRELEELRKLNTDYQIQLTKARGSHGQVRVEKDVLGEKLMIVEEDRERLRVQVKELQAGASSKTAEMSVLESRNKDLEETLAKALARLQSSDVATQAHQESIAQLEKMNVELVAERQDLKTKVNSLELEVTFAAREKETALKAFETLQKQHDALALQQSNWDAITAATEKINMVYKLLDNVDDEEQKELRYHRDRSQALENENMALQKRFKELEAKVANSDRAATTMRQSLTQAQQRSTEWERRAKDYESQLEMVQTKLNQSEQTQTQLEVDLSILKVQVEEQDADSRLSQDQETQLGNQITALESKCTLLQSELEKAKSARVVGVTATPYRQQSNGRSSSRLPPRPDSRASTIYDGRGDSRRVSSYSTTEKSLQPSVWDSMHAPATINGQGRWDSTALASSMHPSRFSNIPPTPKSHKAYTPYARGPSPTPSTVSAVPTQGEDGWWT